MKFQSNRSMAAFPRLEPNEPLAGNRNLTPDTKPNFGLVALGTSAQVRWSGHLHNRQGNVAPADGSVRLVTSRRLTGVIGDSGQTSRLLIP